MRTCVCGGTFRGRPLFTVQGLDVRPTTSRVREALFSMWQHELPHSYFLDLFAGSGTVGIEALSRGAKRVTFVDRNRAALRCVKKNLMQLGIKIPEEAVLYQREALQALPYFSETPFDLIYIDPPYGEIAIPPLLDAIMAKEVIRLGGRIFVEERAECKMEEMVIEGLQINRIRQFGIVKLVEFIRS